MQRNTKSNRTTVLAFNDCSKGNNIDGIKMENAITYYSLSVRSERKKREKNNNALASDHDDAENDNV